MNDRATLVGVGTRNDGSQFLRTANSSASRMIASATTGGITARMIFRSVIAPPPHHDATSPAARRIRARSPRLLDPIALRYTRQLQRQRDIAQHASPRQQMRILKDIRDRRRSRAHVVFS